jgi:hypothetical protein
MTPFYWQEAIDILQNQDKIIGNLITALSTSWR